MNLLEAFKESIAESAKRLRDLIGGCPECLPPKDDRVFQANKGSGPYKREPAITKVELLFVGPFTFRVQIYFENNNVTGPFINPNPFVACNGGNRLRITDASIVFLNGDKVVRLSGPALGFPVDCPTGVCGGFYGGACVRYIADAAPFQPKLLYNDGQPTDSNFNAFQSFRYRIPFP